MKNKEEILSDKRIKKVYKNVDNGIILKIKFDVHSIKASDTCLVSLTCVDGWEHLSVSHKNKIPSWLCMEEMKELCFKDDEECFQFHPKIDDYINNNEYTLHIWRRTDGRMEPPPRILVGFRRNHIEEDLEEAKKLHEEIGCPLTDEELELLRLSSTMDGQKELQQKLDNDPALFLKMCAKMGVI